MGVVIIKAIQAIQVTPRKITAVKTTLESFHWCGCIGLVADVPSPRNRKGFSGRSGNLQSPCCLNSVEMKEFVFTLFEDLSSSTPQRKQQC